MAVTLADVVGGKAPAPVAGQEYELAEGKVLKTKLPTFKVCNAFDEKGYKPKLDKKGMPVLNEQGGFVIEDPRPFHIMVRERLQVIFDLDGIEWDDIYLPVAYQAHSDFLTWLSPISTEPD